jgi:hypothetical protein
MQLRGECRLKFKGNCLCGALHYEIYASKGEIYQCHCSKCRRVTGSSSNANIVVDGNDLTWLKEPVELRQFVTPEGWVSSFCSVCGSKAPCKDERHGIYYVPAGSLDGDEGLSVAMHIYVGSKAGWDVIGGQAEQRSEI